LSVTIKEAINLITKELIPLQTEILPLEEAKGRICTKEIKASIALPPFDNSAMDGYALRMDKEAPQKGESFKVIGKILAGEKNNFHLKKTQAVKIMTGAMIPPKTDCVIPQEKTTALDDNFIRLNEDIKLEANIRKKGEDINIGDTVISPSEEIKSSHIALLASQGITHISVYKKPKVSVFSSGNELKLHFEKLEKSQIYNSNTPYFISRAHELGCETSFIGKADDSLDSITKLISSSLKSDLILTSGGVSVGEADFTKEAFKKLGFKEIFSKVQIRPGKPTTFGKIGNTLVLNLPGNPLAGALNFEIFGRIIIEMLRGAKEIHHNFVKTKISHDYKKKKGPQSVIPGNFNGESFEVTSKFAPGMVNVLNRCNGFIVLSENTEILKKGDTVKFIPVDWNFKTEKFKDFAT